MRSGLKFWGHHAKLQFWKNRQKTVQTHDFSTIDHLPWDNETGLAVTTDGNLVFGINEGIFLEILDIDTDTVVTFSKYRFLYDVYLQLENCGYAFRECEADNLLHSTQIPAQSTRLEKISYDIEAGQSDEHCYEADHGYMPTVSASGSHHKYRYMRKNNKSWREALKIAKVRQYKAIHRKQSIERKTDKQDLHFYDSTTVRPAGDVMDFSLVVEEDYYYSNYYDALIWSWEDIIHM